MVEPGLTQASILRLSLQERPMDCRMMPGTDEWNDDKQ